MDRPLSLIGSGQLEADLDLPVAEGDTIALALSRGAQPYLDYEQGRGAPGHGELWFGMTDSDTRIEGLKLVGLATASVDGLVLHATVQTGIAPGVPSPPAPPSPRPTPTVVRAALHHHALTYTLTRPRRVLAAMERRRGRGWRLERRVRLPGSAGRHRVVLPSTRHRVGRVVIQARTKKGSIATYAVVPAR